jgi:signal transduction histidine kinase
LSSDIQLNLYRILQEQLQNIVKHANATAIEVSVRILGPMIKMRIFDNGNGFNTKTASKGGIGLQNIVNRAKMFSGFCSIRSSEGNGCEIVIKLPLS